MKLIIQKIRDFLLEKKRKGRQLIFFEKIGDRNTSREEMLKNLIAVLENPKTILKDEVYTRYKQGEAVIDKNYSYTEFVQGNKYLGNMLYDMKNDKEQNVDISKLPENKALVKKYSIKLEEMRNYVNKDPFQNE